MAVKKFLIVEDDSVIRAVLMQLLHSIKIPVIGQADDAQSAISLIKAKLPDVVLLDINLSGRDDGFEVLKFVRDQMPDTKVIMISAEATKDRVQEAIKEGASGFIAKPVDIKKVKVLFKRLLQA